MRIISLEPKALSGLQEWLPQPKVMRRIFEIFTAMQRNPFEGIGKPEPLKHKLQGCWSRRIDEKHRIILSCYRRYDYRPFLPRPLS